MTYFCTLLPLIRCCPHFTQTLPLLADLRSRPKNHVLLAIVLKSIRTTTLDRPTPLSPQNFKVGTRRPLQPAREGKKRKVPVGNKARRAIKPTRCKRSYFTRVHVFGCDLVFQWMCIKMNCEVSKYRIIQTLTIITL
jgi:hypothetical protein